MKHPTIASGSRPLGPMSAAIQGRRELEERVVLLEGLVQKLLTAYSCPECDGRGYTEHAWQGCIAKRYECDQCREARSQLPALDRPPCEQWAAGFKVLTRRR